MLDRLGLIAPRLAESAESGLVDAPERRLPPRIPVRIALDQVPRGVQVIQGRTTTVGVLDPGPWV
jgi:hypothetical protein